MSHAAALSEVDAKYVRQALSVKDGHLWIGHYGYVLQYTRGGSACGYDVEAMKQACIAAGLPVIDCRMFSQDELVVLHGRLPIIAVDRPTGPQPCGKLSCASLAYVANLYRQAGAEVLNLPLYAKEVAP